MDWLVGRSSKVNYVSNNQIIIILIKYITESYNRIFDRVLKYLLSHNYTYVHCIILSPKDRKAKVVNIV